jgi:dipeptidyl-peptidase-4
MKKITQFLVALFAATPVLAGQQLSLKEATGSAFRAETISAVKALDDGESYAQISADGSQIVKFSFKTGKQTGVLFDSKSARGPKVERVDGYIMSPDGQRMLIQTNTKPVYRRSFTATYYIYSIANNKMEP